MRAWLVLMALLVLARPVPAEPVSRGDLEEALRQRDAVIADLQRRLKALEAERGPAAAEHPAPAAPAPVPRAETPPGGPSTEEAALQALSRTLVQRGALVLPEWSFEAVPNVTYAHTTGEGLALVTTPEGFGSVIDQRLRQDDLKGVFAGRVGLPWDSQLEVRVPYGWSRQTATLADGTSARRSAHRLGDVEAELGHQFLREDGWKPDLLGAFSWRFPTGSDPFRVSVPALATGAGSDAFRARLTAVKSRDPLVFLGELSYLRNLPVTEPQGRLRTGSTVGVTFGTVLSVNPDTSLTASVSQEFTSQSQLNGVTLHGSDRVATVLQLGVDTVVTPALLLDLSVGVGISHDAPDYQVLLSLPFRF